MAHRPMVLSVVLAAALAAAHPGVCPAAETVPLSALDLSKMSAGWGEPQVDRNCIAKPLAIAGRRFDHGVGTHAASALHVRLDGRALRFTARVGVDDSAGGKGSVRFQVYADGTKRFDSGVMKGGEPAKRVDVDLKDAERLLLLVTSAGDDIHHDHADWAEAEFTVAGAKPEAVDRPALDEERVILTPPPGPEPHINGPAVYGCRPGRPLLYRIPCTGTRPMAFAAADLPASLDLDAKTGILTGAAPQEKGRYAVTLRATNDAGTDERALTIVVGDTLALTPPMGWNDWYTWYHRITADDVRKAADAMVASGMADAGYQYVNIDDCWMVKPGSNDPALAAEPRGPDEPIRPNRHFPDMKGLADYVHARGLKIGLYTSPGPRTCAGYEGTWQHERVDAEQFAEWGFDFLKYDWCSYGGVAKKHNLGQGLERLKRPYRQMGEILASLPRDIVYNLCQYGMGNVWEWGAEVGGNCWRTTGDLGLRASGRLPGAFHIGLANARHWEHAQPGHWNDPDYLLIGYVGNARRSDAPPQMTRLTPNEQYAYMSMWCLMAAPLIYSGDITRLDDFTLNVLCNPEVIAVDQDPLGRQGRPVVRTDEALVLAKPMADGSLAVGLFNLSEVAREMTVTWEQLDLDGPCRVRDLWRQKDLGEADGKYTATVKRHGVMLVRLWPKK
ncbi:MAG: NPCBM/NEW2 domain-containing protein [Phycisphaerae bacterium]